MLFLLQNFFLIFKNRQEKFSYSKFIETISKSYTRPFQAKNFFSYNAINYKNKLTDKKLNRYDSEPKKQNQTQNYIRDPSGATKGGNIKNSHAYENPKIIRPYTKTPLLYTLASIIK